MTEQVFIAKYYAECNRLPWLGPGQRNIVFDIQHCLIQTQLGPPVSYLVLFSSYRAPLASGRWSSQRILVTRTKIPWESGQSWPGHHTSDRSYSRKFIIRLFDSRKVILPQQSVFVDTTTYDQYLGTCRPSHIVLIHWPRGEMSCFEFPRFLLSSCLEEIEILGVTSLP